jgi:hypothetical protein
MRRLGQSSGVSLISVKVRQLLCHFHLWRVFLVISQRNFLHYIGDVVVVHPSPLANAMIDENVAICQFHYFVQLCYCNFLRIFCLNSMIYEA